MAKPRDKCFFEETLPELLPDGRQWLIGFSENSKELVDYAKPDVPEEEPLWKNDAELARLCGIR